MPMTHKERFLNTLHRRPVDVFACADTLWGETRRKYIEEGKMREDEDAVAHFDWSSRQGGFLNSVADIEAGDRIVEETETTKLVVNGNGAKLRWWKHKAGTPEHVDFAVKDREGWETLIKPHLVDFDPRRLNFKAYSGAREQAAREARAFCWAGLAPFEQIHPMCGHEYMLMGMALDPDWVKDMVMTYAELTIRHLDALFEQGGPPDVFWFYEDMGFKEKPFMSPAMYEQLVQPGHARLFSYAHDLGCKVMVHSCGFVEPLVPGLIDAGMDCLQAMEVKAGMDMGHLAGRFGDRITFCGGIDIRVVASNDLRAIDAELQRRITPVMEAGSGYILHSDHSIPPTVEHDTLKYFFDTGRRLAEQLQKG